MTAPTLLWTELRRAFVHSADGGLQAIARKLLDASGAAKSWANLGNSYKAKKDYPAAVRCYEQQLLLGTTKLTEKEPKVQTKVGLHPMLAQRDMRDGSTCSSCSPRTHPLSSFQALANLGHTYVAAGMDQLQSGAEEQGCEALCRGRDSFRLHLQVSEAAKDYAGIGQACGYLGNLFEQAGSPAGAVSFYKRRLAMARKLDDAAAEGRAHCNLGNVYVCACARARACVCVPFPVGPLAHAMSTRRRRGPCANSCTRYAGTEKWESLNALWTNT